MDRLLQEQRERLLFAVMTALPPALTFRVEQMVQQELMRAMEPLALALKRQDDLLMDRTRELEGLLLEVLQSLQPPVEQQLLPDGRWTRPASPPGSGS